MFIRAHVYAYIRTHVYMYMYMYVFRNICIHTCTYRCVRVYERMMWEQYEKVRGCFLISTSACELGLVAP